MIYDVASPQRFLQRVLKSPSAILVGTNIVSLLARMISTIILTRLLDTTAFGAIGIITTFSFVIVMLTDLGFYQYTVRSERINDAKFLDKVWTVRLTRDAIISVIFILCSGPMANYVNNPELQLAFVIMSLTLILDGASSMAFATAAKDRLIGRLSLLDFIPMAFTIPTTIVLAIEVRSYWAMIISIVFGSLIKAILSYTMFENSRRRLDFDRSIFIDIWKFGRFIVPSSVITLLIGQSDKLVLVRFFSIQDFGLYSLASNLSMAPSNLMNSYASRILYPAFSDSTIKATSENSAIFYEFGSITRLLFIFFSGLIVTAAPVIIAILYDDRYINASQYLSILLLVNIINFVIGTENEMLVACGKVRWQLNFNIFRLFTYCLSGILLFRSIGPIGLVWALVVTSVLTKIGMSMAMGSLGIVRLKHELRFWGSAFLGLALGLGLTVLARDFAPNIPLPFLSI